MGRQKNWEAGKSKKPKKLPETPVNAKKAWTKAGGWREFWKRQADRHRHPMAAALRDYGQRFAAMPYDWAREVVSGVSSLGELVLRLKGKSVFAEMSSPELDDLFRTGVRCSGARLALPYLNREIVYFLTALHEIFLDECVKLTEYYAKNGSSPARPEALPQVFEQCDTVDQFEDKVDEVIRPNFEEEAENLRPFLRRVADFYLANRLLRELKAFAKPREESTNDIVEL